MIAEDHYWAEPMPGQLRLWRAGHPRNAFRPRDLADAAAVIDAAAGRGWLVQWSVQRYDPDGEGGYAWADVPGVELDAAREVPP